MLAQICFPIFDTRFAREEATDERGERPAPLWLYGEPPPPLNRVGSFGSVSKRIPPRPYARCDAEKVLRLQPSGELDTMYVPDLDSVQALADQYGHARLSIWFTISVKADLGLSRLVGEFAGLEVAVRHPARANVYERLAESGEALSDLYSRESARTALHYQGQYSADWVESGRPFILLVNTRREIVTADATLLDVPLDGPDFRLRFLPWASEDGDLALPVWYVEAPRGGDAWTRVAEAIEDLTAHYEEYFLCTALQTRPQPSENYATVLQRHAKRLSASLRRQKRHGVDLRAALRLLSDYDRSMLAPRQAVDFEDAIVDRINEEIGRDIRFKMPDHSFLLRGISMTVNNYTGNIINYGIMADNTVTITNTMLEESKAAPALKEKLAELRQPILEAAKALPEAEAKNLLKDYESLTETALRENPPKPLVEAQGNQILNTVKKVAEFAAPVTTIITAILGFLA